MRALPAGPTVIDMLANAAFLIGLSLWLAGQDQQWTYALPFERADHGFYRAAQHGLSAQLSWPAGHRDQIRTLAAAKLVAELVPAARQGLLQAGVAAAEADGLLDVISARAASGQTGAAWQRATLAAAKRHHDPQRALAIMLDHYLQCADTGLPSPHLASRQLAGVARCVTSVRSAGRAVPYQVVAMAGGPATAQVAAVAGYPGRHCEPLLTALPGTRRARQAPRPRPRRDCDGCECLVPGPAAGLPGIGPLGRVAGRQDRGHQVPQRAGEVLLTHRDSAVTGVDDIDGSARRRPVPRREGQDLPDEVFPAASVGEAPRVEHPAAYRSIPADLGDHDPHPDQSAPARTHTSQGFCPW